MKRFLIIGGLFLISICNSFAQAPAATCAGATLLTAGGACGTGTISDATIEAPTTAGCGTVAREGWFRFVATATSMNITGIATNRQLLIQVFSGACGALTEIGCANANLTAGAQTETAIVTGLTIGNTYYVRVVNETTNNMTLTSLCVTAVTCSTCATAEVIPGGTVFPFTDVGSTCGACNDYTSANACGSVYMDGEDYLYSYTPATNITIGVNLTTDASWVGVFITQGCPNTGTCIATMTNSGASTSGGPYSLTAGVTYYFIIDTWPTPDCIPNYTLTINEVVPTCTDGIMNGQETNIDCGGPDCPVCPIFSTGGSAAQTSANCFQLTNSTGQAGAVWNTYMINLNESFDITLNLNFGVNDADNYPDPGCGADGISFILQPLGNGISGSGSGVGFSGITPSLGVVMDTYSANPTDPAGDHISLHQNGNELHGTGTELVPPVGGFPFNVEDGNNHSFHFNWNPVTHTLQVWFDGVLMITYTGDIVNTIFGGNPNVYWGVSASTGGCWNTQTVCMDIIANYINPVSACAGDPVAFTDASISGTAITSWFWDFGDGTTSTLQNPTHTYTAAGTYQVSLVIVNASGLSSSISYTVTITALSVTTSHVNPTCSGYSNGTATVTATTGGTAPYTYLWNDPAPAQTTATCTGLTAGTWSVTVTDADGCQGYSSQTLTNPVGMTLTMTGTATTCGLNNGTATATVTASSSPYDFAWSNGTNVMNTASLTNTISGLAAGTYTVTVTDNAGCTVTGSYTVAASTAPVSTPVHNGNDCFNGNSVNFTNNGTHGGTYAWSFPGSATPATSTTENPTNVSWPAAGTYTVTLTVTLAGCTATNTVNVTIYPRPTITITPTNPLCNGNLNGQAVATVSSGTAPYNYVWNDPAPVQTTATCTGLGAGTWSVTVTDANGCSNTASTTLTQPAVLTASASSTNVLCNGACTGTANASGVGGTSPYSYSWSSGSTNANITNLCVGTYTVTVTDANLCTATTSVNITSPPALTASIVPTNVVCNGASTGAANLTPGGGNGTYTYLWSSGQTTQDLTNIPAGTYTVTVTDGNGCTITASTTITQPTAVTATISAQTNVSCNGGTNGSATVAAGGGTAPYTYLWNDPAPAQTTATATSLTAGTWTVTVTSTGGCTVTASVTITQPAALTSSITAQTNVACNGGATGSATVTAAGGTAPYTYAWNDPAPIQTTATATALTAGTWNVTVTDANGCTSTTSVTITQPPVLTATITAQTNILCNGGSNGSATVTAGGGTAPYTYLWNDPAPAQTTATATALTAGTWTVTVTSVGGCTATASVTITQPAALTSSITAQTNVACNGGATGSATVTPVGGTAPYSYAWNDPAPIQTTATATALTAGTWNVTVTDANGCTSTSSVTITQPAALTATISAQTNVACNGGATGSATVTPGGGTPAYSYLWNDPAPAQTTATGTALTAGTWNVTITDAGGCTATTSVIITQPALLTVSGAHTNVTCNSACNGSATATPAGGTAPYTYSWNDPGFQTTATTTSTLCAGTFSVTVTDANGCTATVSQTITQPAAITVTMSAVNASCGGSDGSASVVAGGGTPGYTYNWSNGGNTSTINAIPSGSYTVTVTDANGCTITGTVSVNDGGAPTATITGSTNVSCNGGCNGTATVSASGGTPPYSYNWSSVGNAATETGICAGTVSVTVTDAFGCVSTASVVITQPTVLNASITSSTNVSCNGGNNGTATVSVSGGTTPYSYLWNDPAPAQTTASANSLTAGSWTVTVTDANGCTVTATATITQPTALTASAVGTPALCNGACNGTANLTVSGGTTGYSYNWSNGFTSEDLTGLCANTYNVTVTDAQGCTANASVTITQPTVLTAVITSSTDVTVFGGSNGSATAAGSNGTAPYSYSWSPAGYTGGNTATYSNLPIGTYTVTVTDANGCTATATVTITQPGAIVLTTTTVNVTCNGVCNGQATVSVTSGGVAPFSYLWTGGSTSSNPTGLCAGSYTVTVTDANGAAATATVTITQPTALTASISSTTNVSCNGGSNGAATVTASGGTPAYTYLWNDPAPAQTTATATALTTGSWTVTVTDANSCTATATATITQPAILSASITGTNVSCSAGCNGSANLTVSGGTTPYLYNWTTTEAIEDISGLCAGSYTVTVTDFNGCTISANVTITQPTALTATSSTINSNCGQSDGQASVTPSGGTATYTYLWSNGPVTASNNAIPAGNYSVTITDANGCTLVVPVTVINTAGGTVSITASANVSCFGGTNGSATATPAGGTAPYTYIWNDPAPVQTTATATGLAAGTYSVTVTDNVGCASSASITITQPTAFTAAISSTTNVSCFGGNNGSLTVTAGGGVSPYGYLWTGGSSSATATGLVAGTYTVTVTDVNGCTAQASGTVTQPTALTAAITSSANLTCFNSANGQATVTASGGTLPYTYIWNGGASPTSAVNTGFNAGTFNVTVTDANGCNASANVTLTQPTAISLVMSGVNENCGQINGSATVAASGGTVTSGYSCLWNNPAPAQTTATATGLAAGTYCVTVTDNNGCTATNCTVITNIAPGTLTLSHTDITCNGACNGSASASFAGGVLPLTYTWNDPANQTTATAVNLCPGLYQVSVVDAVGCLIKDTITITQPSAITNTFAISNPLCNGVCNGSITATASGGTPGYSYDWNDPMMQTTATATGLCDGSFTVTITDNNGCTFSASTSLTEPAAMTVTGTALDAHCGQSDGEVNITTTNGVLPLTFIWNNGSTTEDITLVAAGTYCVTVTDANGCTTTGCFVINNIAGPTAAISASTNISCFGQCNGTATVTAVGGTPPYTYLWTGGQTTQTATNLCAGNQAVTVTDSEGCAASANVTLTQPVALTSNSSFTQPLCNGVCNGTATVNAFGGTSPYTYLWNAGGATASQVNTGLCDGPYSVVVTDSHGCTTSQLVNVTEPSFIALTTTMTPALCFGSCNGNAGVSASGGTVTTGYAYLWNDPAAQTSQTASGLCAGSYTVTVTDNNGCTSNISVSVTQPVLLTASIGTSQNVQCNGACDGWADVNYSGGTPSYTFSWSVGGTTEMINSLCAGNHSVTVTDSHGCTASTNITITEPAVLSMVLTPSNEECYGSCDGSINTVITGGTGPYNFSWTNAASTEDVSGLCVGSYCVTATDSHGCTIDDCATIGGPSILDVVINTIVNAHCGMNDGSASISIVGGITPYSYLWSTGGLTNSISGVPSGNYFVTVTDGNGCTTVETISISDLDGPHVDNINIINVSCFGGSNGSLTASASGGSGTLTYNWNNGATGTTNSGLPAGTYTVTVTDATGCFATGNATVAEPTILLVNINSVTNPYCYGSSDGSASAIAAGGTSPYSYLWSNNSNVSSTSGLSTGAVIITVTDGYGCTASDNDYIGEPTPVIVTEVLNTPSTCFGYDDAVVQINITGGTPTYDVLWMESGNTGTTEGNLAPGTHTVCITDDHGCMVCEDFSTSEPAGIAATTSSEPTTCNQANGTATVTSTSGGTGLYSYSWSPTNQSGINATGLATGNHILNVSDENGCSATFTVTVGNIPAPTWLSISTTDVSCYGGNDGTAQILSSDAIVPYTYEWSNGQSAPVATGMPAGQYWLTITDNNGCEISQVFIIHQPDMINIYANGETTICQGQSTTISAGANGGTTPYTYYWSVPSFGNAPAQLVNPLTTTVYMVSVVDANGCTSTATSIEVTVNPAIDVAAIPAGIAICVGESANLVSSATGGNGGPYNFIWTGSTDHDNQIVVNPGTTTVYEVYATDGCGSPSDTAYVNVIVQEPPLINVTADVYEGCEPVSATFSNFTTEDGVSYVWNFGDPSSGADNVSTLDNPVHEFVNPGVYDISVTAVSTAGCESSQTYENMIQVYPIPEAAFNAYPLVTSVFHANVDFYNASVDGQEYLWSFGDGHESNIENPSNHYDAAGTYQVILIVESDYGCVDTAYGEVIIQEEITFYAPTAITPGNGGRNQYFIPVSIGMDESTYQIAIFDRWGEVIFESKVFEDYWNGRFRGTGEYVELGTYTWLVNFRDINGVSHEIAGTVTVIR